MLNRLPDLVNGDARLVARGAHISLTFKLGMGDAYWLIDVDRGRIARVRPSPVTMPAYSFAICCASEHWQAFWQPHPKPGWQDIFGLQRHHGLTMEGNLQPLIANLFWFKDVLEAPRKLAPGANPQKTNPGAAA